ncbi:polysaccharide biosynthesis protein [Chondrinema litorale]|uniref:polysaccharide biosynthesis protein n=1 Tax=Chondrinema litorale TaxID=2994555 RepID=UPI0025432095|nr:nucleoside-diphosphate sugar epimerase/dehydratase [Chondrinema litorale]UZR95486.1 nucleoside-diphosphate sugar epimerase/dehydratase [Chondrinema litorale]
MSTTNSNGTVLKAMSQKSPAAINFYLRLKKMLVNAYGTRIIILGVDVVVSVMAFVLANLLRFNFVITDIPLDKALPTISALILIRTITFKYFKTYSSVIRFTSEHDLLTLLKSVTLGSFVFFLFTFQFNFFDEIFFFRKSIVMIDYLICLFLLINYRVALRVIHIQMNRERQVHENVVVFGAGSCGDMTRKTIDHDKDTHLKVLAFFDDDLSLHRKTMGGIRIYHTDHYFEEVVSKFKIKKAIIAIHKISIKRKEELVELCLKHNITPLIVPPVENWLNSKLKVSSFRKINIEELLHRAPIALDYKNIASQVENKTILVTGAAGSIGSEIARQLMNFHPDKLILLDQAETPLVNLQLEMQEKFDYSVTIPIVADVRDQKKMRDVFSKFKPDIVYHAAAYKHVPMMEVNPEEAVKVNVFGVQIVANLAVRYGASRFVMVSTDKAVNPTNIMGTTKRMAEMYCQSLNDYSRNLKTRFITTRFGNVLGSNGSVVPRFKNQIEAGGPITVTDPNITRYFMTIPEACQLVLEAGAMGKGGEIFLFDMGEPVKIVDLARKMIRLYGLEENKHISIEFTGLRPGEKLYEELLNQAENTIKTHHDKITIAKVRKELFEKVYKDLKKIQKALLENDDMLLVAYMKQIVPEFKSNCSKYSELDNTENLLKVVRKGKKELRIGHRAYLN